MRSALTVLLVLFSTNANQGVSYPVTTFKGPAHMCPIAPDMAFTARHVAMVQFSPDPRDQAVLPIYWYGGTALTKHFSYTLDIASVVPDKPFPTFFPISPINPKVGDTVYITGYDHNRGMKQKTVKAKIITLLPGTMITDDTPGPGSSGSCVFNSEYEVVGINFGIIQEKDGRNYGYAVVLNPDVISGLTEK